MKTIVLFVLIFITTLATAQTIYTCNRIKKIHCYMTQNCDISSKKSDTYKIIISKDQNKLELSGLVFNKSFKEEFNIINGTFTQNDFSNKTSSIIKFAKEGNRTIFHLTSTHVMPGVGTNIEVYSCNE